MRKSRLMPVVIGAILLALSLIFFTLPNVVTETDTTYRLSWEGEKTYTLQPNGELFLDFSWMAMMNSTVHIDAGNFIESDYVMLNVHQTTASVHYINTLSTPRTYIVDLWPLSGDVNVHAVVTKDVSGENALAGVVLVVLGVLFISLAAIKSREQVRESRSYRRRIQKLGIIFATMGMISFFLFPLGLVIPFFNVGMIILGVELIIIAGRARY
jgi:membrane protein insertase Oxa1/YidC/SpoIIIJ